MADIVTFCSIPFLSNLFWWYEKCNDALVHIKCTYIVLCDVGYSLLLLSHAVVIKKRLLWESTGAQLIFAPWYDICHQILPESIGIFVARFCIWFIISQCAVMSLREDSSPEAYTTDEPFQVGQVTIIISIWSTFPTVSDRWSTCENPEIHISPLCLPILFILPTILFILPPSSLSPLPSY